MTALHNACKKGCVKIVEELINKGADMDCVDQHGNTILHAAIRSGNEEVVQILLTKEETNLINRTNNWKQSALHIACKEGQFKIIEELIKKGADMDYVDKHGNTILHAAIRSGNEDVVKKLLTKGNAIKLINLINNWNQTALHIACKKGYVKIVEELIKKGADMDCVDRYGNTILHAAIRSGNEDLVQILLTKGYTKLINHRNDSKKTALFVAVKEGHIKIIEELIKKGADMYCVGEYGNTILHTSIRSGNEDVVEMLLTKADTELINRANRFRETVLSVACDEGHFKIVEELLKKGADMDHVDRYGNTVLHTAIRSGNEEVVQILLTKWDTKFINHVNKWKKTALLVACKEGHLKIIEELIKKGADMDCVDQNGSTILNAAIKSGNDDVVKTVLKKGDIKLISHINKWKQTALYVACRKGHIKIVEELIKNGADMHCVDCIRQTILHAAVRSNKRDVVQLILNKWDNKLLNYMNYCKQTALYLACELGRVQITKELVKKGADMDCVDRYGSTVLHAASRSGSKRLVKILLNIGDKKLMNRTNDFKQTALYVACKEGHFKIVEELLKKGADMDCVDDECGDTILLAAIRSGNEDVVEMLLTKTDTNLINHINERKETALFVACQEGQFKIVEELIKKGADMDCVGPNGNTILHVSIRSGNEDVVEMLLTKADTKLINHINDFGNTALYVACEGGHFKIIEELLKKNADMNCDNKEGNTILHTAIRTRNEDVVEMLLNKGARKLINHQNVLKQTALHIACQDHLGLMIMMLIDHGANMYLKDQFNCTPLHIAGHYAYDVIRLVVLRGACIFDKKVIKDLISVFSRVTQLNDFIACCVFELEDMENFKVLDNFTIQTVFLKEQNPLYLRNTVLKNSISVYLQSPDSTDRFPVYIDSLKEVFRESQCRINLLTKADQVLSTVMKNQWWGELPVEVRDLVLEHLTNAELKKIRHFKREQTHLVL